MLNLFPRKTKPYFIFTPSYTHVSSGVRALHLLCHALNEVGQKAYVFPSDILFARNPFLNTPLVYDVFNDWERFQESGLDAVVVYPDIVRGNPLRAKHVVRWLLAPAGAYGGDKSFSADEKVYGYTQDIAEPTLCLPTFDTEIFYPPAAGTLRKGAVFYAHKYDKIHGNKLLPLTTGATRLEGSQQEIAEGLRQASICYVYERTEVSVLARLCGCDVFPIVTHYWDGKTPKEFEDPNPAALFSQFDAQLRAFVKDTQE